MSVALFRLAAAGPALSTAGLTVVWTLPPLAVVCVLELCCTFVVAACWVVRPVVAVTAVSGCTAAAVPSCPPGHARAPVSSKPPAQPAQSAQAVVGLWRRVPSEVRELVNSHRLRTHLSPARPTQHRALECKPQYSCGMCALSAWSVMELHISVVERGHILGAYSLNLAETNNQCWGCIRVPPLSNACAPCSWFMDDPYSARWAMTWQISHRRESAHRTCQ